MGRNESGVDRFVDRVPRTAFSPRARLPRTLRLPTPEERAHGIAIAYASRNFCVYRALVERLRDGELFRMETQFGAFEMSRVQFEHFFPGIVASTSYRVGPPSDPESCYYVVGPPPGAAYQFRRA